MASRNISEKDIKLLYGRSASCCNICRESVIKYCKNRKEYYNIGEMAHIIPFSSNKNAPRAKYKKGDSIDNSYYNLILLCRNCHKKVDIEVNYYTPEVLYQLKDEHESFIETQVSQTGEVAKDANTVKIMHELCNFQYLKAELRYPTWDEIPCEIINIGDVKKFLEGKEPLLYPFYDNKLNSIFDRILDRYEKISYIIYEYIPKGSYLRPNTEHHDVSEEEKYNLEDYLQDLAEYCDE